VSLSLLDSSGKNLNQTQVQNSQINAANSTQLEAEIQVPQDAKAGQATITTAIFSGTYQNSSIPIAENKTASLIIAGLESIVPTPTPSSAPTPTPTPTPTSPPYEENSISLFSWLLVSTGFFTFTMLVVFLKRKPFPEIGKTLLPTIEQPPSVITPTQPVQPVVEKKEQASVLTPVNLPIVNISKSATLSSQKMLDNDSENKFNHQDKTVISHLSQMSITAKKIQELQRALDIEKQQLAKEISGLNKSIEEQENAIKNYYDALRNEIRKVQSIAEDTGSSTEKSEEHSNS
jgi:hypothetical protein